MKKITIFSMALSQADVDSYKAVIDFLIDHGWQTQHIGLVPEVFQEVRRVALNAYRMHGYLAFGMKHKDVSINSSQVIELAEKIRRKYQPDIFLTDNERPSSVLIADYLKSKNIPTVRIDHGYLFEPSVVYKIIVLRLIKRVYNILRLMLARKDKKWEQLAGMSYGNKIACPICVYGGFNQRIYSIYQVPKQRLINTGSPYYDLVLKNRKKHYPANDRKKILIVSSGLGIIKNSTEEISRFFKFIETIYTHLSKKYEIYVRLKPGEETHPLMRQFLRTRKSKIKIKFSSSSKNRSYDAVQEFDLVMGDPSQVLHEAVILDVPIILFKYSQFAYLNKFVDVFFKQPLDALVINDPAKIMEVIDFAMSKEYQQRLQQNLIKATNYLFGHLDGENSKRAANVILNEIASAKTKQ